jgi:hypothetical protein
MACLLTTSSLAKQAMALPRRPHHQAAKWQGLPNGLELSRSAEAGGAPHTLAPAGDKDRPHSDSAGGASQPPSSPHWRAKHPGMCTSPPSRLQRVFGRPEGTQLDGQKACDESVSHSCKSKY